MVRVQSLARGRLCSVHAHHPVTQATPGLPESLPNSQCPSGLSIPFCKMSLSGKRHSPFAFLLCPKNRLGSLILNSANSGTQPSPWSAFWGLDWTFYFHRRGPSQSWLFHFFSQEAFPGPSCERLQRGIRRTPPASAREQRDGRAATHRQTNGPTACQPWTQLLCVPFPSYCSQQKSVPTTGWAGDEPCESRKGNVTGDWVITTGGHSAC